jgi:hypothetical protein
MAISKIKSGSLTDNSITTDKINNDAITTAKLGTASITSADISTDIITGQTELTETAADTDFIIIYDTSTSSLKKILRSNIVLAAPTISSVSPTNVNSTAGSTNFIITGTGFSTGSTARLIGALGQIKEFTTVVRNSTTQITGTIDVSNLDEIQTPYGVQVTNGSGVSALLASQIDVDQAPAFVTASGSLGNVADGTRATASFTIVATDPDSTSVIQYEISSGSLPTGMSLNQTTGVISGTPDAVVSDTTSTFVLRAYDSGSNTSTRSFSITILAPVIQTFTSSGTFSVPSGVTAVDVLVIAGGGGGGSAPYGGGGGAGGLIFRPGFPVTPSGTVSVTIGCGGGVNTSGQDTVFGTLTAKGGGGAGGSGGSGGGAYGGGDNHGSATQPTQPGDSGAYGFGFPGGPRSINQAGNPQPVPSSGLMGTGGGGAGAPGLGSHPSNHGGAGGIGKSYSISGTSVKYAGGGGGGGSNSTHGNPADPGGPTFGGGRGASNEGQQGVAGTSNRGGGGGGAATGGNVGAGGGKGIVIVAY